MKQARWIDWKQWPESLRSSREERIYFGHETCFHRLPGLEEARQLAQGIKEHEKKATLVTPFLTQRQLPVVIRLIEGMVTILGDMEVVVSDWGLLHYLYTHGLGTPVLGRILSSQSTDPRVMRILETQTPGQGPRQVRHADGTPCLLQKKSPSAFLTRHYRSCWIDRPQVIEFLKTRGIHRCEISNPGQGIELASVEGWTYSLWVPYVLVSVMRQCPGKGGEGIGGEDFNKSPVCPGKDCGREVVTWRYPGFPVEIFRYCNGLYYWQPRLPADLETLPIDRIVYAALE